MDTLKPSIVLAAIFVLIILIACMMGGCSTITPVHDYCQLAKPIFLSKGEAAKLSDDTAKQILSLNETWALVCHSNQSKTK